MQLHSYLASPAGGFFSSSPPIVPFPCDPLISCLASDGMSDFHHRGTRRRAKYSDVWPRGLFYDGVQAGDDIRAHDPQPSKRHHKSDRIGVYRRVVARLPHLTLRLGQSHDLSVRITFLRARGRERLMAQHYSTVCMWRLRTAFRRLEPLPPS